ncbi:MAG TPA: efflux RND transporter periplasmic adaptor subunit [Pirellulales bacterium]|nr:efflux RND transporter periplasmic adaptor subunit [Pirellulales bacterium]
MSKPWLLIIVVVVCAAIGGAYVKLGANEAAEAANSEERQTPQRKGSEVDCEAVHPKTGGLQRTTTQPGSIIPDKSAELFAKVSGYLSEESVDIGDHVKEGQVLVVIDVPELHEQVKRSLAALDQAKAQVVQAEARQHAADADYKAALAIIDVYRASVKDAESMLSFRTKVYDRLNELATVQRAVDMRLVDEKEEQKHAAEAALTSSEASVLSAQAQATAAQAKIDLAKADVVDAKAKVEVAAAQWQKDKVLAEYTVIKSPYTGIITARHFWPGDFIQARDQNASMPLLTVQKTDVMRVVVMVPDADVPYTDAGDEAVVTIDALPRQKFKGKVSRTAGAEDPESRTMRVEIDLDNKDGILRDGMYGKATIMLEKSSKGLAIPSSCIAVDSDTGKATVFVIRKGKAHKITVEVGEDNGIFMEVRSGLRADDVVARPLRGDLAEGIAVNVVEPTETTHAKAAP